MLSAPEYLDARAPERAYDFDSDGLRLRLHEWGDPAAIPLVLCHGMWDHARGFDLLAPWLAERFRVIAIDARGHGDSAWVDSYPFPHDVHDIIRVLKHVGRAHLVGHSRGGMLATAAACYAPESTRLLVNMEGFGPGRVLAPLTGQLGQPMPGTAAAFTAYLDTRRKAHRHVDWRPYPVLDDLVSRRKRTSPRLSENWLRYFCWHGARRSAEGFRWKVDPMAGIHSGPWRPQWAGVAWQHLRRPMLAVVADQPDTWGPIPEALLAARFAYVPRLERAKVPGTGHFPHMEEPQATARLILDFLAAGA